MTEIDVLRNKFSQARFLLCEWHVITYLVKETKDYDKYGFTAFEERELESFVHLLVGAPSEVKYLEYKTEMYATIHDAKRRDVWRDYFENNWESCRDMWAAFERANVPHLGNTTNNRLESSWRKMKQEVNRHMLLDECIARILHYQHQVEHEWTSKLAELCFVDVKGEDKEVSRLAQMVSEHAFELVQDQYNLASSNTYKVYSPEPHLLFVQYQPMEADMDVRREFVVNSRWWRCDCMFMSTHLLPCRHVIAARVHEKCATAIPFEFLHKRWLLDRIRSWSADGFVGSPAGSAFQRTKKARPTKYTAVSSGEKYYLLKHVFQETGALVTDLPTPAFMDVRYFYEEAKNLLQDGALPRLDGSTKALPMTQTQPD